LQAFSLLKTEKIIMKVEEEDKKENTDKGREKLKRVEKVN
jgi:hypothetical protein